MLSDPNICTCLWISGSDSSPATSLFSCSQLEPDFLNPACMSLDTKDKCKDRCSSSYDKCSHSCPQFNINNTMQYHREDSVYSVLSRILRLSNKPMQAVLRFCLPMMMISYKWQAGFVFYLFRPTVSLQMVSSRQGRYLEKFMTSYLYGLTGRVWVFV